MANKTKKEKRYVVAIDFYVYAENDEDAQVQAQNICDNINQGDDHQADVQVVTSARFGEIGEGKEVFKK